MREGGNIIIWLKLIATLNDNKWGGRMRGELKSDPKDKCFTESGKIGTWELKESEKEIEVREEGRLESNFKVASLSPSPRQRWVKERGRELIIFERNPEEKDKREEGREGFRQRGMVVLMKGKEEESIMWVINLLLLIFFVIVWTRESLMGWYLVNSKWYGCLIRKDKMKEERRLKRLN